MPYLSSKNITNKSANLNLDISIFQHKGIFQLSNSYLLYPINCLCLEFIFASNRVFQLLIIYNIMYKKTERSNYALPSSDMADFPLSIGKAESQILPRGQATYMKQSSSIFNAFNQSRSRAEQNMSLQYSTARPFYGELSQEYYEDKEMDEKHIYNMQQKQHYIMESVKQKKSPKKRLMAYSYSNIMLLQGKVDKILLEQKKRIFMMLYRVKNEDRAYLIYANNKNANFYSVQSNKTSQKDTLYRASFRNNRQDMFVFYQKISKGVNIISGWLQYRVLLDKRKTLNMIFQYGNDRKKFSLELSQSLKVENIHNQNYNLTAYQHLNQISLTNGLPQQIQESLVYTLEHNGQSSRKELTKSKLQKLPTFQKYPSYVQVKQKGSYHQIQSQNSKKSSPMNKLNSFSNSYASPKPDIKIIAPLKLQSGVLKNKKININILVDFPLQIEQIQYQKQNNINDNEQVIQQNILKDNFSVNDELQTIRFDHQMKNIQTKSFNYQPNPIKIQSSAKYSDVSNYQMESTVQKPQQTYQVIVNYVTNNHQPVIQDQTVYRKPAMVSIIQKNTNYKFDKYYVVGKQQNHIISTPKFTSDIQMQQHAAKVRISQEKIISQLDNDRIRIFRKNGQIPIKQVTVVPQRLTSLRGNFSPQPPSFLSNNPFPFSISPEKRILSPKIQTERNLVDKILPNQKTLQLSSSRSVRQHIKVQSTSPDYHNQSPLIRIPKHQAKIIQQPMHNQMVHFNQKGQPQYQIPYHKHFLSPQVVKTPNYILGQNPVLVRKQIALNQPRIMSPLRRLNQKRQIFSKQKVSNEVQIKHYQYIHSTPKQNIQYPVIKKINPSQNHIIRVQQQNQLPQAQMKTLKVQTKAPQKIIIRQNALMNDLYVTLNKHKYDQKRPQSYESSPKLFFNYNSHNQSHVDQQIIVNSHHITKNISSLSRPKSMNSKLFVTLKKEL